MERSSFGSKMDSKMGDAVLLGAIIVLLAMIVGVPVYLWHENKPKEWHVSTTLIPTADNNGTQYTFSPEIAYGDFGSAEVVEWKNNAATKQVRFENGRFKSVTVADTPNRSGFFPNATTYLLSTDADVDNKNVLAARLVTRSPNLATHTVEVYDYIEGRYEIGPVGSANARHDL